MTATLYPIGVTGLGGPCWCGTQILDARVSSRTIDGTVHCRGWCERLRPVPEVTA